MNSAVRGEVAVANRVLVAGASGAIGRALVPLLVARGFVVAGTTRSGERVAALRAAGGMPIVIDVFDRESLVEVLGRARPDVVIHLLTNLTTRPGQPIGREELARTARLRDTGTGNLIEAAEAAGVRRLIAASIAWLSHPAGPWYSEHELVGPTDDGPDASTSRGVAALERRVMSFRAEGIVLRYGRLYGPGTGTARTPLPPAVHVEAAACAAALAVDRGGAGIYTVADDDGHDASRKARETMGWTPSMRRAVLSKGEEP